MDPDREPCDIMDVARCDDRKDRDMDQAQLLSLIGSLYDKLVADVAARVQSQVDLSTLTTTWVDARVKVALDDAQVVTDAMTQAIDERIQNWADTYLDDAIEAWTENNLDLEDAAKEAVGDLDMGDIVRDAVQGLTFEVSVS